MLMHILTVSLDYPPTVGGISAHVYELCQALKAHGHEISVLTKKLEAFPHDNQREDGIRIMPMPKRRFGPTYGMTINRQIDAALATLKPDIIHIHGMRPLEFLRPKPVPIIYTNHTSGFLKRLKKGGYRIGRLRRLFATPDMFLAPSEELLDMPFEIRAPKKFISNGIVPERFIRDNQIRKRLRGQLGLKDSDKLAIITRRMVEKNGVIYLARATQHIANGNLKLLFIGDGPEQAAISAELETHFAGRYMMLGAMSHSDIVPYYSAADLSILPSLMEATSISCLEAMAAALPIICTNVGGLPFLVQDGVNGYLAEPASPESLATCLDKLLQADMPAMGAASREAVLTKFSWMKIAEQTIGAYKQVL
jgi:glycosyltransferase involved in cell wall biosynthesis